MDYVNNINANDYQTILINHLDRLVDFYVTLYAAKTKIQDLKDCLSSTTELLISDLKDKELSLEDINKFNITEEALDIFQTNFSYSRNSQNIFLAGSNQEVTEKYKKISTAIFELSTGDNFSGCVNGELIIEKDAEYSPNYKDSFSILKIIFPCLHQILASDIIKSPSLDELMPLINNAVKSNRRVDIDNAVKESAMNDILNLTRFYPEKLFLGLRYVFPKTEEGLPYNELGFSIHHLSPDEDIEQALRDIYYQHNKFKAYYHNHDCPSETTIQIGRIKSLSLLPCRNNKYIKQLNSIENTFMALSAWRMINLNDMTQAQAIDAVFKIESQRNNGVSAHQEAEFKKKIRDRLPNIDEFIKAQEIHNETLREKYEIMHPKYHSQEFIQRYI